MVPLTDLIDALDALLQPGLWSDVAPNGVQVPAREEIRTVVTGVSATSVLLERAADLEADLVLVHHGLFWRGQAQALDRPLARKLKLLLGRGMTLAAYHLPLDAHLEHGNNALLARALGAARVTPAFPVLGPPIGVVAELPGGGIPRAELPGRVAAATAPRSGPMVCFLEGPDPVRRLGIVSGAAHDELPAAAALGCDAFLTGEAAERTMGMARDHGVSFVGAGHHDTERLGIRSLGDLLAARFGIAHHFVDVPNPV
jgi:dinuclear metal center YbgI/SA1388 family protein